jgi:predicted nucleotidyltransferase
MSIVAPSPTGLDISTALSGYYVKNFIAPHEVARLLNENKFPFVLAGAHSISVWLKEPRLTQDVDIIVLARYHKKVVRLLTGHFPHLQAEDHETVTRLRDRESNKVLIDVMKPVEPHVKAALKNVTSIEMEKVPIKIPTLEMALTLKLAPMISLIREYEKKLTDASDFISMVKSNPNIDLSKLAELGDLVYPGGGKEIVEKVRQVRAGERLQL